MKLIKRIRDIIYLFLHPEEYVLSDLDKPLAPDDPIWNEDHSYSVVFGYGWRELFRHLK